MISEFNVTSDNFSNTLTEEVKEDGLKFLHLKFHSDKPEIPSKFSLQFFVPCIDIYSLWSPLTETPRVISPEGFWVNEQSGIAHGAPVLSMISKSGQNRITVAVSDVKIASAIKLRLYEDRKSILADKINVNSVAPGVVMRPEEGSDSDRATKTNLLGEKCTAEDIANLVEFLASDKARFITGQTYVCDGGRTLSMKGTD